MVAIIKSSSSLRDVLQYNENKLRQNVAQLIHSANFARDTDQLSFNDKIRTIEKLTTLNQRTQLNAVHISLNFDPSEEINKAGLQKIADLYMTRIGFGNQPYLVYKHNDSGHPHIHIVSTNIQTDGRRINMQNIGRNQSEAARKEIEREFRLIPAQSRSLKHAHEIIPLSARKLQYGKSEMRRAITGVLDAILPFYKYSSLAELNAVLRLYNVTAERGTEQSRIYRHNGLVYRALNDQGQTVGPPIKASLIYNKPGLKFLNEKFNQNAALKRPHQMRLKNAIDLYFLGARYPSLEKMINKLRDQQIQTVLRKNANGIIYGITYVDLQTKCVFNGSELGKPYSANQVQERCNQSLLQKSTPEHQRNEQLEHEDNLKCPAADVTNMPHNGSLDLPGLQGMLEILKHTEYEGYTPAELQKKRIQKKRKRKLRN